MATAFKPMSRDEMDNLTHRELAAYTVELQSHNARRSPGRVAGTGDDISGVGGSKEPAIVQVQGPGFLGKYKTLAEGKLEFNKQKAALMKRGEAFTLKLSTKETTRDKWEVVDELKINEDYFG